MPASSTTCQGIILALALLPLGSDFCQLFQPPQQPRSLIIPFLIRGCSQAPRAWKSSVWTEPTRTREMLLGGAHPARTRDPGAASGTGSSGRVGVLWVCVLWHGGSAALRGPALSGTDQGALECFVVFLAEGLSKFCCLCCSPVRGQEPKAPGEAAGRSSEAAGNVLGRRFCWRRMKALTPFHRRLRSRQALESSPGFAHQPLGPGMLPLFWQEETIPCWQVCTTCTGSFPERFVMFLKTRSNLGLIKSLELLVMDDL